MYLQGNSAIEVENATGRFATIPNSFFSLCFLSVVPYLNPTPSPTSSTLPSSFYLPFLSVLPSLSLSLSLSTFLPFEPLSRNLSETVSNLMLCAQAMGLSLFPLLSSFFYRFHSFLTSFFSLSSTPTYPHTHTHSLLVRGCDFQYPANQVDLGSTLKKAVITGNIISVSGRSCSVVKINT